LLGQNLENLASQQKYYESEISSLKEQLAQAN
jgi:prefoldin subunit 5